MKILQVWLAMSTSIRQWALQRPVEGGAAPLRLRRVLLDECFATRFCLRGRYFPEGSRAGTARGRRHLALFSLGSV